MARKSNKSVVSAAAPSVAVVGTVQPEAGKTYVSKGAVKDALRAAARQHAGKWGLVSVEDKTFTITREDGATLVATREVGAKVVLTLPATPVAKAEPVKAEPTAEPVKAAPRKRKAAEKAAEKATSEGVVAAPVLVQEQGEFAF